MNSPGSISFVPVTNARVGQTARQWRDNHPDAEGKLRDHAPLEQLVVPTNRRFLRVLPR